MTPYNAIGLMSGTSMDGVDAVLLETDGETYAWLKGYSHLPYPHVVKLALKAAEYALHQHQGNTELKDNDFKLACIDYIRYQLGQPDPQKVLLTLKEFLQGRPLNFATVRAMSTDLHQQAVFKLLKKIEYPSSEIAVVGYHGQTLYHAPNQGLSIQLGDAKQLANAIGVPVIANFRANDIANGGQGAPLAPLYHQTLAVQHHLVPIAIINGGGISNITTIFGGGIDEVVGFDTGPGSCLLDRFVRFKSQGELLFDPDGQLGFNGEIDTQGLQALWRDSFYQTDYLRQPPPKSLDSHDLLLPAAIKNLPLTKGCATLATFTAQTIVHSFNLLSRPVPKTWLLCGGSFENQFLTHQLKKIARHNFGHIDFTDVEVLGSHSQSLEAELMAYLAVRSLKGLPLTVPSTTGVKKPVSGGDYYAAGLLTA